MPSLAHIDVSRETISRLEAYQALLLKWNKAINLVSRTTEEDFWTRHILDSAQLFRNLPDNALRWLDVGSGGGLPGLVVAIIAKEKRPDLRVTLVESDQRKSTFLRQAGRELDLSIDVLAERIESITPFKANVLSARALAPLSELLPLVSQHLEEDGVAILPKGERFREELKKAQSDWQFDVVVEPSMTDNAAKILTIRGLTRAAG